MYEDLDYLVDKSSWTEEDEKIVHRLNKKERSYLALRIKEYDGILIDLSFDNEDEVRLNIAKNPATPFNILKRLSEKDSNKDVRLRAAKTIEEQYIND
ncbi:MAG: hypothetical protein ACOCRK_11745 [bacterium]